MTVLNRIKPTLLIGVALVTGIAPALIPGSSTAGPMRDRLTSLGSIAGPIRDRLTSPGSIAGPIAANAQAVIQTGSPNKTILGTLTTTGAKADGWAAVFGCQAGWSGTSNINYRAGSDIANLVAVRADASGNVCVLSSQQTHVIFDQTAEIDNMATGTGRVLDTRSLGKSQPNVPIVVHTELPDRTIVGNVTVVTPDGAGFLALYPCVDGWTGTSNLNFSPNQTVANAFFARTDKNGDLCVRTSSRTDVIVDLSAQFASDSSNARRLLDTRAQGRIAANTLVAVATGRANATIVGNLTVTGATSAGYGSVVGCPAGWPNVSPPTIDTSNINFSTGDVAALFVARTDDKGQLCVRTSAAAHVIVDETMSPSFSVHVANRVLDTRVTKPGDVPLLGGCKMFPSDNAWNQRIDSLPVHPSSGTWVNTMGPTRRLHPDFGGPYGIPFLVVPADQPLVPVTFTAYGDESDPGPYPIPLTAPIEGGNASSGDRHVLVLQSGSCKLFEMGRAFPRATRWDAEVGAVFDLSSNALRPLRWTSADAAGLPMIAGLVRFEDIVDGALRHAVRFTSQCTQRGFIYPATHQAGVTNVACPPMGARFRLKATFDTSSFSGQSRIILDGLKSYGMIVADNGSNWFLTGSEDSRWNVNDLEQLKSIPGSAFEVVDTGPIRS